MSPLVSLKDESQRQRGFYAPAFEVSIAGVGLPREVLRDVIQVTYKDNYKKIDSFELTVNNRGYATNSFKYAGAEPRPGSGGNGNGCGRAQGGLDKIFEPCNRQVELRMGYVGDLRVMLTGHFTTMEPSFAQNGESTLSVRGLNVLHQLRRKQNTRTWRNKKDSQMVKSLESDFPIPIEIDRNVLPNEPVMPFLAQRNQYDIDFIFSRARERGYVVLIQEADPNVSGSSRRLYFGPSQAGAVPGLRDVTFELKWGASLLQFRPTLTTANQISKVTVKGWSRNSRSTISYTADVDDPRLNRNRDLRDILCKCDPREEHVVDEPVFTRQEARERALAILQDRQKEMVKASGTTVGLADLRSGKNVQIEGLGPRFSGSYFVTETTHTINDSGYITQFQARREN